MHKWHVQPIACITKKKNTECVSLALCEVTSNVSSTVGVLHSVKGNYYHMGRISVSHLCFLLSRSIQAAFYLKLQGFISPKEKIYTTYNHIKYLKNINLSSRDI